MPQDPRERTVHPVLIPVVAVLAIGFVVFFFSRILLAVEPAFAALIALAMALNVLTAAALVSSLPHLRTAIIVGALALGGLFLAAGGVLAMAVSEEARLLPGREAAEERPEGQPPAGERQPPSPVPPEESPAPDGERASTVVAGPGAAVEGFETTQITLPAEEEVVVSFRNEDPQVPHNVALYTDETYTRAIFVGDIVTGPTDVDYAFRAPEPGTYAFRCDVHPQTMTGTATVE